MKKTLAVLLIVHKNIHQIERLLSRLGNPEIDIYIHCDARWEDGYKKLLLKQSDSIFVTNNRYESNLDSWQLIEAPMELYRYSIEESKRQYQYYCLMSGQDYPIVSTEKIVEELKTMYPKPFIDCTPYDRNNWIYSKFKDYSQITNRFHKCYRGFDKYYRWINNIFARGRRQIKKPAHWLEDKIHLLENKIDNIYNPKEKLDKLGVEVYGGSAWWILPDIIFEYVYHEYIKNDTYIKILSKVRTPEELFFQIVSMRSPFAELIDVNPKEMVLQNCKTYAYFFDDNKPFKCHPYEFTVDDKELLIEKSKTFYFARKFDSTIDSEVFDFVDNELLNIPMP